MRASVQLSLSYLQFETGDGDAGKKSGETDSSLILRQKVFEGDERFQGGDDQVYAIFRLGKRQECGYHVAPEWQKVNLKTCQGAEILHS